MHVFSTLAGLSSLKQQLQGVNDKSDKSKVISSFQLIFCGSPNPMAWSTVQNLERNRNWSLPSLRHKNGGVKKNGHRPGKVRKEEPKSSEEGWEIVVENDTLVVSRMLFCKWFSWPHFFFWSVSFSGNVAMFRVDNKHFGPIVKLSATKNTVWRVWAAGPAYKRNGVRKCSKKMLIQVFAQSSPNKKDVETSLTRGSSVREWGNIFTVDIHYIYIYIYICVYTQIIKKWHSGVFLTLFFQVLLHQKSLHLTLNLISKSHLWIVSYQNFPRGERLQKHIIIWFWCSSSHWTLSIVAGLTGNQTTYVTIQKLTNDNKTKEH